MDAPLWQLVALAAGTGGSMLAVGSVAGAHPISQIRGEGTWLGLVTGWSQGRLHRQQVDENICVVPGSLELMPVPARCFSCKLLGLTAGWRAPRLCRAVGVVFGLQSSVTEQIGRNVRTQVGLDVRTHVRTHLRGNIRTHARIGARRTLLPCICRAALVRMGLSVHACLAT